MPFRVGEALNYEVTWASYKNAASVQLTIPERRDLYGWETWHFRATVHTLSPVRSLFPIDDQFDSYTDSRTLESRQFETYLNQMGRKDDRVLHLVPTGQVVRAPAPEVAVLPGTRDPLGAFYALRAVDWQRTPHVGALVYDGHDIYEMQADLDVPSETVAVAAGNFSASRVTIHLFQHGKEVYGTDFSLWLAHDAASTPVLLQADLPLGNLRAELAPDSR